MITGIQITKAANDDLLNSFWLLDSEKAKRAASLQNPALLKMKLWLSANWARLNTGKFRWKLNRKYALKAVSI